MAPFEAIDKKGVTSCTLCKDRRHAARRDESATCVVTTLPSECRGILDVARHEIQTLEDASDRDLADNDALDDGFLCFDLNVLTRKLQKWYQMFPAVTPFFAIKCNPDPMVIHWLAQHASVVSNCNVAFDCASLAEVYLAVFSGAAVNTNSSKNPMQRFVYANPQRAESELAASLQLVPEDEPVWLTLDGPEELYKMKQVCDTLGRDASSLKVVVRIYVPDKHSTIPLGEKFGMSLENIPALVQIANSLGIHVVGISFHCGSGCHDPQAYQTALEMAEKAIEVVNAQQSDHPCWLLDIGGGFPGWDGVGGDDWRFVGSSEPMNTSLVRKFSTNGKDAAVDIADVIRPILQRFTERDFTIISEPGRYFVEASAFLVSRIYKVWEQDRSAEDGSSAGKRVYQIPHGVQGVFKDVLLCDEAFIPVGLYDVSHSTETQSAELFPSQVRGPSGDPLDLICDSCMLPKLDVGDWLVFDRMGAYTLSVATMSGRPIIRYVCGDQHPLER